MDNSYPVNSHQNYHAHLYFDASNYDIAVQVLKNLEDALDLKLGRIHQKEVGPHPKWSCQVIFNRDQFDGFIPWLDSHRQGLSVLVHAVTGDDFYDHTALARWLGEPHALKLEMFKKEYS